MNGFVRNLSASAWTGSGIELHEIESPTWAEIEAAMRALNGRTRNDVYLLPDSNTPETYVAVGGGADNRCPMFICHNSEQFDEAMTPDAA